jgi:hypothetical protein
MAYDWITASTEARRHLYRSTKQIVDRHYLGNWQSFYDAVFANGFHGGAGYEDNFRSGRIGRKPANAIAQWLATHHPIEADALERAVSGNSSDTWQQFVNDHATGDHLTIVPLDELGIVGFAAPKHDEAVSLRMGQEFCFGLHVKMHGTAIAFQQTRGEWFGLPLSDVQLTTPMDTGDYILPRAASTGVPLPLSEETDSGLVTFVFLIAESAIIEATAVDIVTGSPISAHILRTLPAKLSSHATAYALHRVAARFR